MTTSIQDHPNYGLDVHTVQKEMSIPLGCRIRLYKATVQTLNEMRREIGLRRLLAMLGNVERRVEAPQIYAAFYPYVDVSGARDDLVRRRPGGNADVPFEGYF